MRLKFRGGGNGESLDVGFAETLDAVGPAEREEDWALLLLRSLQKAPKEIVVIMDGELPKAVLREAAKSEGDAGAIARLALSLLERCGR